MSIFKCKMCGGTIEFLPAATVGVCDSCGTKQTLPRLDDDRRANLYDRANHFRRNNEFDKAMGIYEQILNEDNTDAEAYWSLVLCRYGIEYVEDPLTHRRIPTVNRAQFTSVFDDDNYQSALRYADPAQKAIYFEEAQAINEIQKGILQISQKEEPFDVFICYKETDAAGRRTPDSVLANDLYHQLTQEGFKVFFSRITLENKLGTAYEPYIFAALNSAKVMVVLGTRPEYFNAVWVKNEWARYLALIKNGAQKTLIPAYKDMDPYDLPDEFSHLQALDMSKLGFMQDLIRGIKKISGKDQSRPMYQQTANTPVGSAAASSLLRRAFMFLEDGNWQEADQYCEKVLDMEPENGQAYLGKLMAELQVKTPDELGNQPQLFDDRNYYQKAMRFGDERLRSQLTGYITQIQDHMEHERLSGIYNQAIKTTNEAFDKQSNNQFHAAIKSYEKAENLFRSINDFQDAEIKAEDCKRNIVICNNDNIYTDALALMSTHINTFMLESAIKKFQQIPGWRDSYDQIGICMRKISEIKMQEEAANIAAEKARQKAKQRKKIFVMAVAIAVFLTGLWLAVIKPKIREINLVNKYGKDAVARYGMAFFDRYGEDFIDRYGLDFFEQYGLDFVEMYGTDAISEYEPVFFQKYKPEAARLFGLNILGLIDKAGSIHIGDTIKFGNYEQDNNSTNGKEPIEWKILARDGTSLLIISNFALDAKPYHTSLVNITWEHSSIRQWLNDDFFNSAFSSQEKLLIQNTIVHVEKNPKNDSDPGNNTTDKIFLLSLNEANQYFSSDSERAAKATSFAKSIGADTNSKGNTLWWLRSPGISNTNAAYVSTVGFVDYGGYYINSQRNAIRPALWINLDAEMILSLFS